LTNKFPDGLGTVKDGAIHTFESGTLQVDTYVDGKEVRGKFLIVYYIPDIRYRLLTDGRLFFQGWEP